MSPEKITLPPLQTLLPIEALIKSTGLPLQGKEKREIYFYLVSWVDSNLSTAGIQQKILEPVATPKIVGERLTAISTIACDLFYDSRGQDVSVIAPLHTATPIVNFIHQMLGKEDFIFSNSIIDVEIPQMTEIDQSKKKLEIIGEIPLKNQKDTCLIVDGFIDTVDTLAGILQKTTGQPVPVKDIPGLVLLMHKHNILLGVLAHNNTPLWSSLLREVRTSNDVWSVRQYYLLAHAIETDKLLFGTGLGTRISLGTLIRRYPDEFNKIPQEILSGLGTLNCSFGRTISGLVSMINPDKPEGFERLIARSTVDFFRIFKLNF